MIHNISGQPLQVLAFTGVFLPGYKGGGPIKTVKNLFEYAGKDILFKLVTSDRDLGDNKPYTTVTCGKWNELRNVSVFYAQPSMKGCWQIGRILNRKDYDVVYLNSFFSLRFSLYPLLFAKLFRKPVVLSPRGEFSQGALGLKPVKKRIFIAFYKFFRLHNRIVFQASSKFEESDLYKALGARVEVRIAENIGAQEFGNVDHKPAQDFLRLIFVSRISPMKNLSLALESLRSVRHPIIYDIYGPIEDKTYWEQCQKMIETLPEHIQVTYKGSLQPSNVVKTMSSYDAFYLPTKGENFGHSIAEAFCAGLPVLIADTTPWRNLQEQGIGWDLPVNNLNAFSTVLDELAAMPPEQHYQMRQNVLLWAKSKFSQRDAIKANISMFKYVYEKSKE